MLVYYLSNLGMGGGGTPVTVVATLRQAVFARLSTSSAITALVGARIYFGALPQSASLLTSPAITYWVVSRPYGHHLGGCDGTSSARVQISAHSTSEATSERIAEAVRDLWDGYAGTMGLVTITATILQGHADIPHPPKAGTDQWTFEVATDYRLNHRVSFPTGLAG